MPKKKCICRDMVSSGSHAKSWDCPVHGYQSDPGCYRSEKEESKMTRKERIRIERMMGLRKKKRKKKK
jgi:hypothetical protein